MPLDPLKERELLKTQNDILWKQNRELRDECKSLDRAYSDLMEAHKIVLKALYALSKGA